jgi:hypothetical protein
MGCWLYLGAQHVTVVSPFTHYASPQLRQDALDELNSIYNQLSRTTVALVASQRKEAKVLALNLAAAQEQLVNATADTQVIREALLEEQAATSAKDTFIAELQSIIAGTSKP